MAEFKNQLEDVMDSKGIDYILTAMEEIFSEKSAHVLEVWQDKPLSNRWQKLSNKINAFRVNNQSLFPL